MEAFNIEEILRTRTSQRSFHVASETYVRIEFRNMTGGEKLEPFVYDGSLVITCYRGEFMLHAGGTQARLLVMGQAVVSPKERVLLECTGEGTVQIIWAPAYAATTKG